MSNTQKIETAYKAAHQQYLDLGVDTEAALKVLKNIAISLHCWQGDDVGGFEVPDAGITGGGIQATGNYPGKGRTPDELRQDLDKALDCIPGTHRLNLHACYASDTSGKRIERDKLQPEHFASWIDWAKAKAMGMDFNPTFFSHPKADDGFTLTTSDPAIRNF